MSTELTLQQEWDKMKGDRSSIERRWEQYAEWTLPFACPMDSSTKDEELQRTLESIGARAVNHMSNRMVMILFSPHAPFFRLQIDQEAIQPLIAQHKGDNAEAREILQAIEDELSNAEKRAMSTIDAAAYRTQATMACKFLLITGNALMYDAPGSERTQVYGPKDYVVRRDVAGNVLYGITCDQAAFSTFAPEVREALQASSSNNKRYDEHSPVKIYTKFEWDGDKQLWVVTQAADLVKLNTEVTYSADDLPWIPLTWNLKRGDDYGRGLVEDFAGAFHTINVLTRALVEGVVAMCDIKWLVNPGSMVDVEEMNKAASGSYHQGADGDIVSIKIDKIQDLQYVTAYIERLQRDIGMAFLLNSSIQRDAERVTAEEIRMMANELETSNGGIYSHLAATWQMPQAKLLVRDINLDFAGDIVFPKIVTGMDSLSRNGDMENIRLFISDLAMLEGVPEEIRGEFHAGRFAQMIGTARGIDYKKFLLTADEKEQRREQELAEQERLLAAQAQASGAAAVATEAAKQE